MPELRPIITAPGYRRSFAHEGGQNYRVWQHDLQGAVDLAKQRAEQVNEAPKVNGETRWHHDAVVPTEILMDYLRERGIPWDVYARNENNERTKFKRWFLTNPDFRKLCTSHYTASKPGSNKIIVPTTYRARKDD